MRPSMRARLTGASQRGHGHLGPVGGALGGLDAHGGEVLRGGEGVAVEAEEAEQGGGGGEAEIALVEEEAGEVLGVGGGELAERDAVERHGAAAAGRCGAEEGDEEQVVDGLEAEPHSGAAVTIVTKSLAEKVDVERDVERLVSGEDGEHLANRRV